MIDLSGQPMKEDIQMHCEPKKRCSYLLIVTNINSKQINTAHLPGWVKCLKIVNVKCRWNIWAMQTFITVGMKINWYNHLERQFGIM